MKITHLTQRAFTVLTTASVLLLMPALVVNTVMVEPAIAQENGENGEAPVNGVDAGAGGASQNETGAVLPIAAVGGLALVGAGLVGYRYARKNAAQ